jgi:hypothetical protein
MYVCDETILLATPLCSTDTSAHIAHVVDDSRIMSILIREVTRDHGKEHVCM